ncbi:MAG TPA: RDD family protein [Nocardioides sp.]
MSAPLASTPTTGRRPAVRPWPRAGRVGDAGDLSPLGDDDLVTGEAVALQLRPATIGPRVLSGFIDVVCVGVAFIGISTVLAMATVATDEALFQAASILSLVLAVIVLPATIETLSRGRSVGKLAMGLRVVRDDGGPIVFQHAFNRSLIAVVEIYGFFAAPAFLVALLHPRGKRLGDLAAGTYVISDRASLRLPLPAPMPPPLAPWAASADIAPPPAHLTLAARQFLARAHTLEPRARHVLALQLADQLHPYVAPPPPPGTPAEAFLCAVLAARRDRDLARLQRETRLRLQLLQRRRV